MRIRCPCGQVLQVADALGGWRVLCPACKRVVRVPAVPGGVQKPPTAGDTAERPLPGDRPGRSALIAVGIVGALVMVLLVARAGAVTVALTALCGLLAVQGLLLGGARVLAALVGMVAALVLAPPIGGLFAGPMRSVFGVPRLLAPLSGTVVAALVLIAAAVALGGRLGRRLQKRHPLAPQINRWLGFGLGTAEGVLVSVFICWGLAMLRPVAQAAARTTQERGEAHPLAHAVTQLAEGAAGSPFGRAAEAVNPLQRIGVMRLSTEVALTATDRAALNTFVKDPAVVHLLERPEIRSAVERLKADQDLMRLVEERDLHGLLDNPTLVEVASDRALRRLAADYQVDLLKALERARLSRSQP